LPGIVCLLCQEVGAEGCDGTSHCCVWPWLTCMVDPVRCNWCGVATVQCAPSYTCKGCCLWLVLQDGGHPSQTVGSLLGRMPTILTLSLGSILLMKL
jgi:hypothetical protein